MILRVGLTGGIASGKSAVASILREHGCVIIDADEIVRELYSPGAAGFAALVQRYGLSIVGADGAIDRPRLSAVALDSAEGALELNALIHPLVIEEQQRRLHALESEKQDVIAVVEAALLLESGGKERFDRIVVVDAPNEAQVERGVGRGLEAGEVQKRMARQMDRHVRLGQADYVIDNSGSPEALRVAAEELVSKLRTDLQQKK